jgi:hypothetical protein
MLGRLRSGKQRTLEFEALALMAGFALVVGLTIWVGEQMWGNGGDVRGVGSVKGDGRVFETPGDGGFEIDPDQAFTVMLGRGSGMDGLDTVRWESDGNVTLWRRNSKILGTLERAKLTADTPRTELLLKAVNTRGVMGMKKMYSGGVSDGTQWVLLIQQGENKKAVYLDNWFPHEAAGLAGDIDGLLEGLGLREAVWETVDKDVRNEDESRLWKSIQ